MTAGPNIVKVAALIGDPSRVTMLMSLSGGKGKALPASELARAARISPQTASSHLAKLVEGGLLIQESYGRHRYYRLASSAVAYTLEALQTIAPPQPVRSLRESNQLTDLQFARTCYDHLAGKVGVALTDRLLELALITEIDGNYRLNEVGRRRLIDLGVDVTEAPKSRRHYARPCLDWSERRHHLAGSLGAALTKRLFELEWIKRLPDGRAVRLTDIGIKGLTNEFGVEITT